MEGRTGGVSVARFGATAGGLKAAEETQMTMITKK